MTAEVEKKKIEANTKKPGAQVEKDDRSFLPDIPMKTVVKEYRDQLHDVGETLFLRFRNMPGHVWYESDDVKHVFVDGCQAVQQTAKMARKLLVRDAFKWDQLEILDTPCSGMSGPVLLMEGYTWTALCVLAYGMGTLVGAFEPLTSLLRPIFPPLCAVVVVVALPFLVHARLRKSHWPEDEQRSEAFHAAIAFGALASYGVGKPSTDFALALPLLALWIGTVAGYRDFYKPCRVEFMNVTITLPLVIYTVVALVFFKRGLVYVLAAIVMCGVVAVDLQLKLGRLKRAWASKELEYWGTTAAMIGTHFLLTHFVSLFTHSPAVKQEVK